MIISDLNYLENASEAINLEGGVDFALNLTHYDFKQVALQTGSASGPGGSVAGSAGMTVHINNGGLAAIGLGLRWP